jgi:HemK-like putative methylase
MPRLGPRLLHKANNISPYLPLLLPTTRELSSALAELRWLHTHILSLPISSRHKPHLLERLCWQRGKNGVPLQYLLGSQPFGDLDILCRRHVFIPRPETEELAVHVASLLNKARDNNTFKKPKIIDLCTGSGCIILLLASLIPNARAIGVDISNAALRLSLQNRIHNAKHLTARASRVSFLRGNMLRDDNDELVHSMLAWLDEQQSVSDENYNDNHSDVDLLVSNPPYISIDGYNRETERSARYWEPTLALVGGDCFYPRIAEIAGAVQARAMLVEVGGQEQAHRVKTIWKSLGWENSKVWKDFAGRGRSVVAWRDGGEWISAGGGPHES